MVLLLAGLSTLQAQVFQKAPFPSLPQAHAAHRAADTQAWWGYVSDDTDLSSLGVTAADTYHCAIFIPGDNEVAAGKTIEAIRFALVSPNATDIHAWVATALPASLDDDAIVDLVDVSTDDLGTSIEAPLSEPYAIPATGVYVGYSFTVTSVTYEADAYPIIVTGSDMPDALYLRTESAVKEWGDFYGQGYGSLFLQVLLSGQFADDLAVPFGMDVVYAQLGQQVIADLTILNNGITPITSIDYTITTATGITRPEQHADLDEPIPFGAKGSADIVLVAEDHTSLQEQTVTITKVNGHPNNADEDELQFILYSLSEIVPRNVVVEEYTGTGCGWCPRGIVGMEKMRNTFGNRFVGIGIHQYNSSDAMYLSSYANIGFSGAPSCTIDRKAFLDPYYGSADDICDDFSDEMAIPALVKVGLEATWNADRSQVSAKATLLPLLNGNDYQVAFVLVADGLTGTATSWRQSNYYYQYAASQVPDDLAPFAKGGVYGKSAVTGLTFNDVAIASSYVSNKNQVPALTGLAEGQQAEASYTLSLPTKTVLRNAIITDKVYAVAIVIGADGTVQNAIKVPVIDSVPDAISDQSSDLLQTDVQRYALDGRRLSAPQRGLNILRTPDGRTHKLFIK